METYTARLKTANTQLHTKTKEHCYVQSNVFVFKKMDEIINMFQVTILCPLT